jgi:hypothetical protein
MLQSEFLYKKIPRNVDEMKLVSRREEDIVTTFFQRWNRRYKSLRPYIDLHICVCLKLKGNATDDKGSFSVVTGLRAGITVSIFGTHLCSHSTKPSGRLWALSNLLLNWCEMVGSYFAPELSHTHQGDHWHLCSEENTWSYAPAPSYVSVTGRNTWYVTRILI